MASSPAIYRFSRPPRTVAFVHDSHTYGGMELHMLLLLRHLDRARFVPVVFVPGYTEEYRSTPQRFIDEVAGLGIPILRPPHPGHTRALSAVHDTMNAGRIFRQSRVDVIHVHTNHPSGARRATLAARLSGVRAVVRSEHLPPTHFGMTPLKRAATHAFDMLTDCLIAGSHACRDEQMQIMHRRNVRLSLYGIELDPFHPNHNIASAKQRLGFDPSVALVGAIGRLSELKGHRYYIDAAAHVAREFGSGVNFLLVGDGPLRAELEAQVAGLGLSDRFHFAGFQADTVPYMEATDIAVMPSSINEGISLAMLEYMAMGKPMIATDDPSFEETVVEGESGLIVPKKDAHSLGSAILRVLRDEPLAARLRSQGLAVVRERFDIRRQAGEMMDLYDLLLDARAGVERAVP